jgi:GMP synthase-like glutamine amidotransferase
MQCLSADRVSRTIILYQYQINNGQRLLIMVEHNSFDDDAWILKLVDFTEKLLKQDRIRIIGVCFGHQILGRALGAKVGRSDNGWEIAVLPVELTAKGKEVFQQDSLVSC